MYSTGFLFISYADMSCPAQSPLLPCPLSFLKLMYYSPLFSPPACAALGSPGTRRTRTCRSKSSWGTPRWSRGWSTWWLQELGLFSLAKRSLTRRDSSAVFNSLCLPAVLFVLFWWQYMNERLRKFWGFLDHVLHVICILLLPVLHLKLWSGVSGTKF